MRDAGYQLSVVERLTVWMAGCTWLRRVMVFVLVLPVVAITASFQRHPVTGFVIGFMSLCVVLVVLDRMSRVDLTGAEERRVTEAQLTGWSTGDPRLDGWATHRGALAASRRGTHGAGMWLTTAVMASVVIAVAVVAAVRSTPWWLLCLVPAPLYLASPIAFARSDPGAAAELLGDNYSADD